MPWRDSAAIPYCPPSKSSDRPKPARSALLAEHPDLVDLSRSFRPSVHFLQQDHVGPDIRASAATPSKFFFRRRPFPRGC